MTEIEESATEFIGNSPSCCSPFFLFLPYYFMIQDGYNFCHSFFKACQLSDFNLHIKGKIFNDDFKSWILIGKNDGIFGNVCILDLRIDFDFFFKAEVLLKYPEDVFDVKVVSNDYGLYLLLLLIVLFVLFVLFLLDWNDQLLYLGTSSRLCSVSIHESHADIVPQNHLLFIKIFLLCQFYLTIILSILFLHYYSIRFWSLFLFHLFYGKWTEKRRYIQKLTIKTVLVLTSGKFIFATKVIQ